MRDKQLIMKIIEEIEKQSNGVNIRSARGYGAGHPWIKRTTTNLGAHENDEDEDLDDAIQTKAVQISKAFLEKEESENEQY